MHNTRLNRVIAELQAFGLTQMIVSDPASIRYLTGVDVQPMERLFALYINADGGHKLFLNRLFHVPESGLTEIWMTDTDDGIGLIAQNIDPASPLGVDKNWPARFLLGLMERHPALRCRVSSVCVDRVRARKDADEAAKMRKASAINDTCMGAVEDFLCEGVCEREVADFIEGQFALLGAAGTSFSTIVSFGANAADPHHVPDDTRLCTGDCVVIDMGCVYEGYCSDMTRTFFCGAPDPEYAAIHDLVREANEIAEQLIRPGVRFCELDAAARNHIAAKGYGEYFTHRLGHSIGTECHEAGDVSATNTDLLEAGNTFSIEPGVYLPGRFGVRIEDLVLVTEDGCEILNHANKRWTVI